jgi:signal transduction histidine kinase
MTVAQMIQSDAVADGTSRDRAGQIIQAAQRAQRLVREFLTMAKPRPPTFEAADLNAVVKQTRNLARPQCSVAGIKLVADFEADLPRVTADPHRLGQVLMNLLANARQAMEAAEKGRNLTVSTRSRGEVLEIRVADDGPGIPAEVKAKIFEAPGRGHRPGPRGIAGNPAGARGEPAPRGHAGRGCDVRPRDAPGAPRGLTVSRQAVTKPS